jgi:WhiB family redox-sensing transcriptional regulator
MAKVGEQADRVARFRSMIVPSGYDDTSWREQAVCQEVDADIFFPVGNTGRALEIAAVAKAVCAGCPVQAACLRFAVTTNQEYGIWGGCDEEERKVLRRRWRAKGVPIDRLAGPGTQPAAS